MAPLVILDQNLSPYTSKVAMASVLIVDDERSMRDFLKILLEKEGHKVITADSGARALDVLASSRLTS